MKIWQEKVLIRDLTAGFVDDGEGGVRGFGGKLDIRPPYQREFVYKDKQRNAVIETVGRNFPLNVMYFAVREDGSFEVMDGQQRILSICQYVDGDFSHNQLSFGNLPQDKQDAFLDYELFVYFCEGSPSEKLDWFRIINIAGEKLTDQELRNAVYHGAFVSDAKRWFSRVGGPAASESEGYVNKSVIRQELLETAINWICINGGFDSIEDYMDQRRQEPNATELWDFFQRVLNWAKSTFPVKRKELEAVDWGVLFRDHGKTFPDGKKLEAEVARLMSDDEVTRKAGIYSYVLDGKEKHLSLRQFTPNQKREAFERQLGKCANPKYSEHESDEEFDLAQMEGDHIIPWSQGGKTTSENCQMLCVPCNRAKGSS